MAKYKSRATRASLTADGWRDLASRLREVQETIENAEERAKAEEQVVIEMAAALGIEADSLAGLETHDSFDREEFERKVNEALGDTLTEEEAVQKAADIVSEFDASEVEALAEEMGSWRDNMQGTGLENTEKYSRIEESADALESIETDQPDISSVDDIETVADDLESRADELEAVEFPGMYG